MTTKDKVLLCLSVWERKRQNKSQGATMNSWTSFSTKHSWTCWRLMNCDVHICGTSFCFWTGQAWTMIGSSDCSDKVCFEFFFFVFSISRGVLLLSFYDDDKIASQMCFEARRQVSWQQAFATCCINPLNAWNWCEYTSRVLVAFSWSCLHLILHDPTGSFGFFFFFSSKEN